MPAEVFLFLLFGFIASIIGTVYLGPANLSVLQTATKKATKASMPISYGASVVEIIYGIHGIFAESLLYKYFDNTPRDHRVRANQFQNSRICVVCILQ